MSQDLQCHTKSYSGRQNRKWVQPISSPQFLVQIRNLFHWRDATIWSWDQLVPTAEFLKLHYKNCVIKNRTYGPNGFREWAFFRNLRIHIILTLRQIFSPRWIHVMIFEDRIKIVTIIVVLSVLFLRYSEHFGLYFKADWSWSGVVD